MDLKKIYVATILLLAGSFISQATHVRGGVISVCKTGSRTFEISLTGYTSNNGSGFFGNGSFDLGDGTLVESDQIEREVIGSTLEVEIVRLKVVHEYSSEGAYTVSYQEESRPPVQNIDNSHVTDFYIETTFESLIQNCTPSVSLQDLIPVFRAGQIEIRDLLAHDEEGDRIRYLLVPPLQSPTQRVNNYRYPDHSTFYSDYEHGNASRQGNPVFAINKNTGTLRWDAPGDVFPDPDNFCHQKAEKCGDYTIALEAVEYREIDGMEVEISRTRAEINLSVASGIDASPSVFTEQDNFCSGEGIVFEVQSEKPYSLTAMPSSLIANINGKAYTHFKDSTFSTGSEFTVAFTDFEEGQFVTFQINAVDGEKKSSFTYLLSTDCEQYILDTPKPVTAEVVLYPNPAYDKVWIKNGTENMKYAILSIDGRRVTGGNVDAGSISLPRMRSGVYLLRLFSQDQIIHTTHKLVIRD